MNYYKKKYLKYKKKLGGDMSEKQKQKQKQKMYEKQIRKIIDARIDDQTDILSTAIETKRQADTNKSSHLYTELEDIRADCHPDQHHKYIDKRLIAKLGFDKDKEGKVISHFLEMFRKHDTEIDCRYLDKKVSRLPYKKRDHEWMTKLERDDEKARDFQLINDYLIKSQKVSKQKWGNKRPGCFWDVKQKKCRNYHKYKTVSCKLNPKNCIHDWKH
jgi:hypothetical protein